MTLRILIAYPLRDPLGLPPIPDAEVIARGSADPDCKERYKGEVEGLALVRLDFGIG